MANDKFKWDCRPAAEGGVCLRNPFFCGSCGSVDVEIDQNVSGARGDGEFFTCRACEHVTEVPKLALGGRWGAIRAEETAERWDAEDAGWDTTLRGSHVEVAGPGPVWVGFLMFHHRNCKSGHGLNGIARVRVVDPRGSGRKAGAVVDVGAGTLREVDCRSIPEELRTAHVRRVQK